jgi:hypothetical protein
MRHKKNPGRAETRHGERYANSKERGSRSSVTTTAIDFKAVNRTATKVLPIILARWLPQGRRIGREYVALNPTRPDRHLGSFKIIVSGQRAGMWADFATGDRGGDVISLAAFLFRLSQTEAARRIAGMLGLCHD